MRLARGGLCFLLPGCYFVQLAAGQLALVNGQRPLADAVASERDPERRRLLELAPDVRSFGRNAMQLRPGANYTGYVATEAEAIVFVVVASEKLRFEPYSFWFPIVGEPRVQELLQRARCARRGAGPAGAGIRRVGRPCDRLFDARVLSRSDHDLDASQGRGRVRRGAAARDGARAPVCRRSDRLERAARELRRPARRRAVLPLALWRRPRAHGRARATPRAAQSARRIDRRGHRRARAALCERPACRRSCCASASAVFARVASGLAQLHPDARRRRAAGQQRAPAAVPALSRERRGARAAVGRGRRELGALLAAVPSATARRSNTAGRMACSFPVV